MVKKKQHKTIAGAITAAEKKTSAQIACVVTHDSDAFQEHTLLCGLFLGSAAAFILWQLAVVTYFPALMLIQIVPVMLAMFIPGIHHLLLRTLPRQLVHRRAARRAYEAYVSATHGLPASTPLVLLYISMGERYTHIIANHKVRDKVQNDRWKPVVAAFTGAVKKDGVDKAAVHAIQSMADILAKDFPA